MNEMLMRNFKALDIVTHWV